MLTYRGLQGVRDEGEWEHWLLYVLDTVSATSRHTLTLIERIRSLMAECKRAMRAQLPKIYSHELLSNLFRHPYTRVQAVQRDAQVSRPTASRYLRLLTDEGLLKKLRVGRHAYYINQPLVEVFRETNTGEFG